LDKPSAAGFSGGPITAKGKIVGVIHGGVGTPDNPRSGIGNIFTWQLGQLFH
jgi:hypothetical protein